jgi:DNA (cytosine-5)-methyltransferase 1
MGREPRATIKEQIPEEVGGAEFNIRNKTQDASDTKSTGLEGGIRLSESIRFKQGDKENASNSNKFNGNLSGFRAGEISQFKTSGVLKYNIANANATMERRNERKSKSEANIWEQFPTESPLCSRNDGLPSKLAGITFSKHRNESIKSYGNAIVPQVAYQIFKAINEYENIYNNIQNWSL